METLDRLRAFLAERGYAVEQQPQPVPARLFATKRGHSLGIFLPYTDFVFVHDLDEAEARDLPRLRALHEQAREYASSRMRVPRALRYRVPNIITIAMSESGFGDDVIAYAKAPAEVSPLGGERHAVYLLDIAAKRLVGSGLMVTHGRYGAQTTTSVNPTNRVFRMLEEFERTL